MTEPNLLPKLTLADGTEIPGIGLGTFGSDKYSPDDVGQAVLEAGRYGWRHFDCASVYGYEMEIGQALSQLQKEGVSREELWVTSKVWNDSHDRVEASCEQSLKDLGLDYLDLYLIHWPFPNHHAPKVDVSARDAHAVPFTAERYLTVWKQMESLKVKGLVRQIGTSNMTAPKLKSVLPLMDQKPTVNQLERHPHFQQNELVSFLKSHGILPVGYSPVGSPSRPERDRTPEDTVDTEDPAVLDAAERLGVHPAVVCVLWQIQTGTLPIPFSVKPSQFRSLLDAAAGSKLSEDELSAISQSDKGCRLIKGQVFLWNGAKDWRDLWDE